MRNTEVKKVDTTVITSLTCDKCQKTVDTEDDVMEAQEFVHIDHHCGFATGDDGTHWQVDLCYDCAKWILGPYWRDVTN